MGLKKKVKIKMSIILNGVDLLLSIQAELLRMHELEHSLPINTAEQPNLFSEYVAPFSLLNFVLRVLF